MILSQPLVVVNRITQYDLTVTVSGGGLSGQAGAVRHGLAKALTYFEPDLRPTLKKRASSPAIRAWSSARSTATARRARASSSPSAEAFVATAIEKGGASRPFCYRSAASFCTRLAGSAWRSTPSFMKMDLR